MAIKIDMTKTYDIVEWYYLKKMLEKNGFSGKWVNWIIKCVESVSY